MLQELLDHADGTSITEAMGTNSRAATNPTSLSTCGLDWFIACLQRERCDSLASKNLYSKSPSLAKFKAPAHFPRRTNWPPCEQGAEILAARISFEASHPTGSKSHKKYNGLMIGIDGIDKLFMKQTPKRGPLHLEVAKMAMPSGADRWTNGDK